MMQNQEKRLQAMRKRRRECLLINAWVSILIIVFILILCYMFVKCT